jgi:hypothetical protein
VEQGGALQRRDHADRNPVEQPQDRRPTTSEIVTEMLLTIGGHTGSGDMN